MTFQIYGWQERLGVKVNHRVGISARFDDYSRPIIFKTFNRG